MLIALFLSTPNGSENSLWRLSTACCVSTLIWKSSCMDSFSGCKKPFATHFFNTYCMQSHFLNLLVFCLNNQQRVKHPDYNNELTQFLPRTIILKKPPGAQLGFNIRGGKASQLGIFISKVSILDQCINHF